MFSTVGERSGALIAAALVTCGGEAPRRGRALEEGAVHRPGALAWRDGIITYAGPADELRMDDDAAEPRRVPSAVLPGFVDCHTHLPFYGWRADEFEARLAGRSYRDLHGEGGIYRSARLLAEASDDEVMDFSRVLTTEMLAHGTTALELKTGYGLSVEAELRQARLARQLAESIPQSATVTLLACHAVPHGRSREQWVSEVCAELIPAAAAEELADAVDVYVEDIAFSVDDLRKVADAAGEHGLAVRTHADQLGASGAAEAAAQVGAVSADHLNHIGNEGIAAMARAETIGVLLPVSTLVLRAEPPPVSRLVEAGVALAIATDFNPGTSPCLSMPQVIQTAGSLYGLSTTAAISAATVNAACVLSREKEFGSLQPGLRANFVITDDPDPAMIAYRPGHNPVVETWIEGERFFARD